MEINNNIKESKFKKNNKKIILIILFIIIVLVIFEKLFFPKYTKPINCFKKILMQGYCNCEDGPILEHDYMYLSRFDCACDYTDGVYFCDICKKAYNRENRLYKLRDTFLCLECIKEYNICDRCGKISK